MFAKCSFDSLLADAVGSPCRYRNILWLRDHRPLNILRWRHGGAPVGRGARRPVSRVLSVDVRPRDGHSSGTPVTGRLARPTRAAGPETDLARSCDRAVPPLLGLAPGGVCHAAPVAGRAVRSYRTLSPLLACLAAPSERSALCGTFPGVAPAGRYPAPCSRGARTFLRRAPEAATAAIRPSGPP